MKKYSTKRIFMVLLAAVIIVAAIPGSAFAASATTLTLKVDGSTVSPTVKAVKVEKEALVSQDTLSNYFGATVSYSASSKKMTVKMTAYTFVFKMGSKSYTLNGKSKTAGVAAQLVNKKPMVPAKAFATGINGTYSLSGKTCNLKYFSVLKGSVKITGSTTVQPIAQAAADALMKKNKGLSISVAGGGSGQGVNDTIAGSNNLGMSSRDLDATEKSKIKALTIARDGIAIIVHPSNKVKNLTKKQAEDIFLGNITNWKDVGGANAAIVVMTRETGSGTRATLEEMLLEKKSVTSKATPYSSSKLIKQKVAASKNAIGYDSIGFVDKTVKALSLNSVAPSVSTITQGKYLMGRNLYMLSKGTPTAASAMFVDYLKTVSAQQNIIAKEGYIRIK